jgi:hypothetical protein
MSSRSIPPPKDTTDTYHLIRQAIEKRQQVLATYRGYDREMCPHSLGVNKRGERQALFYQFAGESGHALGPPGSPDNWRCLRIDELSNVSVRGGDWHTAPAHTRPQTCVYQRLDLEILS